MSDIQIWYTHNNDMIVELSGVTNPVDGLPINDATVLAHLRDDQGADVAGITWPVTMNFTGTDGEYQATVDKAADILDGSGYALTITASSPGGLDGEWRVDVGGEVRSS